MKCIYVVFSIILALPLLGQSTYSRIYDIDKDALRNSLIDFEILDDGIYTYSQLACSIEDNKYRTCIALSNFNLSGDIQNKVILDSLDATDCCEEPLTTEMEKLIITSYVWGEFSNQGEPNKVSVIQYDKGLNQLDVTKYNVGSVTHSPLINSGIEIIDDHRYIYGRINNPGGIPDSVHITKTDFQGNVLDRFYYSYGNSSLEINTLQATPDGNLAIILKIKSPPGSNNGFDGYQLMKIDLSGDILDIFAFEDLNNQPNRLLVTSDGEYVFATIYHPITGFDIFTSGFGLINKMNKDMDTVEWSVILPNDQLVDGRHYRINDHIEVSNGDLVACGMAYDNTDTELGTGVPDKNSVWNGFIVRLSPEGVIKWLHLYKNPNELLPKDEFGRFRPSELKKIKELPNGNFIASGNVTVTPSQLSEINEVETEGFHLCLLMVDENGCLEGYDCEEIIRINQSGNLNYTIGDEWTYEEEFFIGDGNGEVGYKVFSIQDTYFDGIHTKYVIDAQDTFYIENKKMYFWDEYFQEYIMYYDWKETESYDIKYYNQFTDSEEIATVVIDSITYKDFDDQSIQVQHVHILNSGTIKDYNDDVYEGVGAGYFGIKFLLGCGLCDDNPLTTKLRCFKNDTVTYQFVPYSCDSTWLITNVHNINDSKVYVYPNPTNDIIYIEGINSDIEFELYSSSGQFLERGTSINKMINFRYNGLLLLKLRIDEEWIFKRIVKIE